MNKIRKAIQHVRKPFRPAEKHERPAIRQQKYERPASRHGSRIDQQHDIGSNAYTVAASKRRFRRRKTCKRKAGAFSFARFAQSKPPFACCQGIYTIKSCSAYIASAPDAPSLDLSKRLAGGYRCLVPVPGMCGALARLCTASDRGALAWSR